MPKAPDGYQPLLYRGSRGSLWLADDHLLVIETTRFLLCFRETYRRLDFKNIQAVLHSKSQRGTWLTLLFIALLCACLAILATSGFDSRPAQFTTGIIASITLIAWVIHFIKGPTTHLVIQTTVCPWRLKMASRQSHVLKVLTTLEPLCRQAQQDIHTNSTPANRPPVGTSPPPPPVPPLPTYLPPPVAGVHPLTIPAWLCYLAFSLMMAREMVWNAIPATLLMLGFATAAFTLFMIALTRGGGTLALGGRAVFTFAMSMLCVSIAAGYAATLTEVMKSAMRDDSSDFTTQDSMIRALAKFPEGSPDAFSYATMAIISLTGISALSGLAASIRRNKLQRSSTQALSPLSP